MPVILTPFLGVLPHSLAQPSFPPCLFSPAQSWKSPCCSPLPQPLPLGQPMPTYLRRYLPPLCAPSTVPSSVQFRMPNCICYVCGGLNSPSKCSTGKLDQPEAAATWVSSIAYVCFFSIVLSHLFCSPIGLLGSEVQRLPLKSTHVCMHIHLLLL